MIYPSVTKVFAYEDVNRVTSMSNTAFGTCAYTYGANGMMASEDGPWSNDTISFTYNGAGKRASLGILSANGPAWSQTYGYDSAGRLTSVVSLPGTAAYLYSGPGILPISLSLPNTSVITNTYDSNARLTGTYLKSSGGTTLNSHTYGYNQANQRTNQTRVNGSYVNYTYDNIGQLASVLGKTGGGSDRYQEQFSYGYDADGKLTNRTDYSAVDTFTANDLNELSTGSGSGALITVAGNTTTFGLTTRKDLVEC